MIEIDVVMDGAGVLSSCTIAGHAGAAPKGGDIVCAAVSVLAGTAHKILSEAEGIKVWSKTPERGLFDLKLEYTQAGRDFLSAAGLFLITGLASIAGEYPAYCRMKVHQHHTINLME
ncbi:MAG: ribosomal-processing cysteine protease Prp [Treponema sp.]|jgi:uncharacterized protein YsxB (DUF464 family)|nr:ribosomal-processing cysteine protease Prp [Treponema sp.]